MFFLVKHVWHYHMVSGTGWKVEDEQSGSALEGKCGSSSGAQLLLGVGGRGRSKGPHTLPSHSVIRQQYSKCRTHKDAKKWNVDPLQYSSVWVYRKVQGAVSSTLNYSVEIRKVINLFQTSEVVTLRKTYRISPWSNPGMVHQIE